MPREYLTSLESVRNPGGHHPAKDRVQTTEEVGDPDHGSAGSAAEKGAAGGALLGAAVAGPLGAIVGGAVGAGAGGAKGSTDDQEPHARDQAVRDHQVGQIPEDKGLEED